MADKKISALTAASTPLAGTEVLPIVQSGSTVKVANNDLRPKQIQSNATSGVLQVAGPGSATTRVMTTPDANFTVARTDAAQSFTGDQTLSTGNIVQGTAAKGINFTANTPAAGMTSQLFNAYEEGTWVATLTPETSGTITLSSSFDTGSYTRNGRIVHVQGQLQIASSSLPVGSFIKLSLPFAIATLSKLSGRFGTTVNVDFGGTQQILYTSGVSGDLFVSMYVNATTATAPRNILFSFSYTI